METVALPVERRNQEATAKQLRWENKIPAVLYGHGKENLHLQIDYQTFRRAFNQAGQSTIIDMAISGQPNEKVLVQDIQYHPVTDEITHVDFVFVRMDEKITTNIPLEFVGQSQAIKEMAGMLDIKKHEIEVKCLPGALVSLIEVDISSLVDFNAVIHVADLSIPEGIEVLHESEEAIVTVIPPRVEEQDAAPVAEGEVEGESESEAAGKSKDGGGSESSD